VPNYGKEQIKILTILSQYIKRFWLEFFGLKNQTRGHVLSHMNLNEPFPFISLIAQLYILTILRKINNC
jgi:hypothetical protein